MGNQHIIELNGQRYDALTGALITTPSKPTKKSTHIAKQSGGAIDGFARPARGIKPNALTHKTQKSQTLMRKTVKKPTGHASAHTTHAKTPHIQPSSSVASLKPKHAAHIERSPLISRFGTAQPPSTQHKPAATTHVKTSHKPVAALSSHDMPPVTDDPIARGLANATSHEQPKLKKPKFHRRAAHKLHMSPRVLSAASFAFAFLLMGGFFVYQNIPGLTMRLAASRAGVQGQLPAYQPAGFRINGGISYRPGQIAINYKSNSDDRNFQLTQDASSWDSQTLLDNYVAANHKDYQTVQDKGKTVYMYGGSNATWVDGGIWYRIEGESNLNSDQLLRLAASL